MASQDEKLDADLKRMKTRSFAGYVKDRVTGSADFDKSSGPTKDSAAKTRPILGGANPVNKDALEAAGYKRGGAVKAKSSMKKSSGSCW